MTLHLRKSIFFSFLFYSSFSFSQNLPQQTSLEMPLSMEELFAKAVQNTLEINLTTLEAKARKEEISESKRERFPEIALKGNYEYATNIPVYEDGLFHKPTQHEVIHLLYKVSTEYYFNVYNGNKLNLKINEKEIASEVAEIQKNSSISEVKLQACIHYLNLQRSRVYKKLITNDIANQEKQLDEIKSLYSNGVILKSDVLRIELKLSNQKMMLIRIENDIAIANQKLNILLGLPDHQLIDPFEEMNPSLANLQSYEDYLNVAENKAYDYHISEKLVELKKINLKKVKANVKPKVGLYGEFYLANPQIFLYPYSPSNYTLGIFGVRASIPLSDLFINKPKERIAKINLEREEVEHHHVDDKMRQQVFEKLQRFKESLIQIEVSQSDINQSEENARIVKQNYIHQSALITDLLDADVQSLQSKFNYASSKIEAQIHYYQLQNVLGTL